MKIGFIGLGKMGANMAHRLLDHGHDVVVWNRSREPVDVAVGQGAAGTETVEELVAQLEAPRTVWVMLPAGEVTEAMIDQLLPILGAGDVIVDGGNSRWKDTEARAARVAAAGPQLVDCGTSGGIWGYANGYCLMVGGSDEAVAQVEPAFRDLAPENGYLHVGPVGSGHYVKMVHNGIEYGMMQAIGEGFEVLETSGYGLDLAAIAELWQHSSVVRSWLVELAALAFRDDPKLAQITDYTVDSGEARWTIEAAMERDVPTPVITMSLLMRFMSRQDSSFALRTVAALRNQFGGHAVRAAGVAGTGGTGGEAQG
jgi:6-phosphogluconate dehydrogenase